MRAFAPLAPGLAAAGLVLALIGGGLVGLVAAGAPGAGSALLADPYLRRVVVFTFWQATLSTALAVGLAVPVARAIARRRFPGREPLLRLFGLPFVMPVIVAVFGIVAVWGRTGWANDALTAIGLRPLGNLYGLPGILLAHVFFNLPLAVRAILLAWSAIPGETWRLATQLGFRSGHVFRFVEAPVLRQVLPGIALVIFSLCFTSFAVVLALGGGPAATVLELAIYQALRLDLDLARAGLLALVQLAICAAMASALVALGRPVALVPELGRLQPRPDVAGAWSRAGDALAIALAAGLVVLPLAAVVVRGLAGPMLSVLGERDVALAAGRSLLVGLLAAALAAGLAWSLALAARELRLRHRRPELAAALELAGSAPLATSALALGAGLFALLHGFVAVFDVAIPLVIAINALFVLPYAARLVIPALHASGERYGRLCEGLGIVGRDRFRLVDWPAARASVGLGLALGASLAAGDLGAIALFGTQDSATLPLVLYQRMASYRMDEAAVVALLLVLLALGLFVVLERGVGGRERG